MPNSAAKPFRASSARRVPDRSTPRASKGVRVSGFARRLFHAGRDYKPHGYECRTREKHCVRAAVLQQHAAHDAAEREPDRLRRVIDARGRALARTGRELRHERRLRRLQNVEAQEVDEQNCRDNQYRMRCHAEQQLADQDSRNSAQ